MENRSYCYPFRMNGGFLLKSMTLFKRRAASHAFAFVLMLLSSAAFAFMKPHYGGSLRIADDLAPALSKWSLFSSNSAELKASYSFPFLVDKNVLSIDLSSLPADKITEIEQAIGGLQNE